jgi:hypothetical protein
MVVHSRKAQVFEREMLQPFDALGRGYLSLLDLFQQLEDILTVHK